MCRDHIPQLKSIYQSIIIFTSNTPFLVYHFDKKLSFCRKVQKRNGQAAGPSHWTSQQDEGCKGIKSQSARQRGGGGGGGGIPCKNLSSIHQLSSCGNIFKWSLFILFDSLSKQGTMRRELGQWNHSGPLLLVRWVQMYN